MLKFVKILENMLTMLLLAVMSLFYLVRTRTTEDVDIFIEELSGEKLNALYGALKNTAIGA